MKKILFILCFIVFPGLAVLAQDDGNDDKDRMQVKMREYLQKRLGLSRNEVNKFGPVFGRYLLELRKSNREISDPLIRQQRIAELRIHYRDEFRPILGDQKAVKVFVAEKEFYERVRDILNNRKERIENIRTNRRM